MEQILDREKRSEINLQIVPLDLLRYLDYYFDKIQVDEKAIRAFCPVHKEVHIRTLKIDLKEHVFKCSFRACPGNEGGDLLDLLCQSLEISDFEALLILSESLKVKIEFPILFKDHKVFFEILQQKVASSDWKGIPALVQDFMELPEYKEMAHKKRVLELLKPTDLSSLQEKVFNDIWEVLLNATDYQGLLHLAGDYPELLKSLEQFKTICDFLEKEGSKEQRIKWYQQKANWIRCHDAKSPEYYQTMIKIMSLDSSAVELEDGLRLLEYYTNQEKFPRKKVKKLTDGLIESARESGNAEVVQNIQNLMINQGIISPEETFPQMQERLHENPRQTFSELETLLNSLSTEADRVQAARFLSKNASYIAVQAPSTLLIMSLHVLLESGYFDSPGKREEFLKLLQKRPKAIALNSPDSIFIMERLMAISSGKEKKGLLNKLFDHFYREDKLDKIQKTATELFSILTKSKESGQMESTWKKVLKKSKTLENYEWLYQKAAQHFPEPLNASLVKFLFEKLPAKDEFKSLRFDILRKILFDYDVKSTNFLQEYLQLIIAGEKYQTEHFPHGNFFKYFSKYWKSPSVRGVIKEYFLKCDKDFRSDFAREIVLKLEETADSEDSQFWLIQYLKLADSGAEPFFYIDKASLLLNDYFDRDIFDKTLRELQEYTDSSYMVKFIKMGYEFYLKKDDWKEVKKLFDIYGGYFFPDFNEYTALLEKAREKEDAEFFIQVWDKYFSTFEQDIPGLSDKLISYYLGNVQPEKLNILLNWLTENKQIDLGQKILAQLLHFDSHLLIRKGLLDVPHSFLTAKLEEQYIQKLHEYQDIKGILEYYRSKIDHLIEKELFNEALKYCEKIRLLVPEDLFTLKLSAEIEEKIGNLKKALVQYEQMYEIFTKKELFQDALSVLEKMYKFFPEEPGILKKWIDVAEKIGEETGVIKAYDALGALYEKNGKIDKAGELYFKLYKEIKPPPLSVLKKLFKYALLNKKPLEAKHYLMEILPVIAEQTSPEDKLKYIKPVLSQIPDDLELMILYAEKMLVSGKKREAYHILKQAGEVALRQKKIEQTIAVYEKIVRLNPSSIAFHSRLGKLYNRVNTPEKSLAHYNEAARICYRKKRFSDAVNLLKKALDENPFDLDSADFLGELYLEMNKPDKALPLLINIAEHCEKELNFDEAFIYYYNAVRIAPQNISYRLKVLSYAQGNIPDKDLKQFYEQTLYSLREKREVSLLTEIQEGYSRQFGIEKKIWEDLLEIYIEEQLTEPACQVVKELLDEYEKNTDFSSIVRVCKQYLEHFSPYPGFFRIYLPALYRESTEQFYQGLEDWTRKYAAIPEYTVDFLETIQKLQQDNPADYKILESDIRLLCELGEKDSAWELFRKALKYVTDNKEMEQFIPYEGKILQLFEDQLERFMELVPFYRKNLEHFLKIGRKITSLLLNEKDQDTAFQLIHILMEHFPDDIELNASLLQMYTEANDEIKVFEQTKKLALLYEEDEYHTEAYNLYENIYKRTGQDHLEEKLITLLLKQGDVNTVLEKIEEFSQKALEKEYDLGKALVFLEKGRQLNPENLPIYKKLLTVKKRLGMDPEVLAREFFTLAGLYKKEGAPGGVRTSLYEAVQSNPSCLKYWLQFFKFLQEQEKHTDIFRYIPQCISSLSGNRDIQEVLAALKNSMEKVSLEVLLSVLEVIPVETADIFAPFMKSAFHNSDRVWEGLKYSMEKEKPFLFPLLFEIFFNQVLQNDTISNKEGKIQKMLDFCLNHGLLHESMEIYRLLIQIHPESVEFLQNFIEIANQIGVSEEEEIKYRIRLADAFMKSEKPENALKIIEQLYRNYPDNLEIKEKYVEVYPLLGMEEEIVDKYRTLARSYKEKEPQKARYFWQKVRSLLPEDDEAKKELSPGKKN